MTKQEAIEQMKKGYKVWHKWFLPDEWMAMTPNGDYIFDDQMQCQSGVFWQY